MLAVYAFLWGLLSFQVTTGFFPVVSLYGRMLNFKGRCRHSLLMKSAGSEVPNHVAYIVDGNGRWAESRGLPRPDGHSAGANVTVEIAKSAFTIGVNIVTFYLFSNENWRRPQAEIGNIFAILENYLRDMAEYLIDNKITVLTIGDVSRLPPSCQSVLEMIQYQTSIFRDDQDGKILVLALSYGGRQDLVDATRRIAEKVVRKEISPSQITEETIHANTMTGRLRLPDPDLIIRTSGEMRLSNFLLYQCAYSEFQSCPTMWPDFTVSKNEEYLMSFQSRSRRFGGVKLNALDNEAMVQQEGWGEGA